MLPIDDDNKLYLLYVRLEGENDRSVHALRDDFKFELLLRNLSLKQQLKIRNTKNETDRFIKLLNSLFLGYVIAEYEKNRFQGLQPFSESRGEYGKPYLENRDYQYNLSDEDGIVMLAIGFKKSLKDKEIGIDLANPIDIERFGLNRLEDFYKSDFKDIFGSAEIENLDKYFGNLKYEEQLSLLSRIWSLKESYCKYVGVGLTAGMQNFQFFDLKNIVKTSNSLMKLQQIQGYSPLNLCFEIPDSSVQCSVFSHYDTAEVVKLDAYDIINYYTRRNCL